MIRHSEPADLSREHCAHFEIAQDAEMLADQLLLQFNDRHIKLFDLSPGQRIFLFILTRSIKSYTSILLLCRQGYGQDVATLLRGLVENLITARYILYDPRQANHLAERFVAYKWIIFKRALPEEEREMKGASLDKKREFYERKALVIRHAEEFKKKFGISSDRALVTWSGKTVRDMAKAVSADLLAEYDVTFRRCSRFSHPSILGDNEYMIQDDKSLVFSSLPSSLGVLVNLESAIQCFLECVLLVNQQFGFNAQDEIRKLQNRLDALRRKAMAEKKSVSGGAVSRPAKAVRECVVVFHLRQS